MEKSESIKEISKALNEFQYAVKNVTKDGANPFFKSKYATLENVISTIKSELYKANLSFAQFPDGDGLYTIVMHESGEWIGAHAALELKGHTPQDQGSAITYMRRYALSAALGLATEEDDDGNAASKPKAMSSVRNPVAAHLETKSKKAEIKKLIDEKVLEPLDQTPEAYARYVADNTQLELVEANYDAIIKALKN